MAKVFLMLLLKYNAQHATLVLTDFCCLALEICTHTSSACTHEKITGIN